MKNVRVLTIKDCVLLKIAIFSMVVGASMMNYAVTDTISYKRGYDKGSKDMTDFWNNYIDERLKDGRLKSCEE